AGPVLCVGRLCAVVPGGDPHPQRARSCPSLCACGLRPAAGPDPRLPRHGRDLAVVDHGTGQSLRCPDLLLAFLREAVEGNVRWRTGVCARYALVVSADPLCAAAPRSAAW